MSTRRLCSLPGSEHPAGRPLIHEPQFVLREASHAASASRSRAASASVGESVPARDSRIIEKISRSSRSIPNCTCPPRLVTQTLGGGVADHAQHVGPVPSSGPWGVPSDIVPHPRRE